MIKKKLVEGIKYAGIKRPTYAILDDNGLPIFIPTQWLLSLATVKGSPKTTLRTYGSRITSFLNIVEKAIRDDQSKVTLKNITDEEIQGFLLGYIIGTKQNQISTYKNYHAALVALYKWANDMGLVEYKNIPLNIPGVRKLSSFTQQSELQVLNSTYLPEKEFIDTILSNVKAEKPFEQERDELVLHLGYYAGFRTHESTREDNLRVEYLRQLLPKHIPTVSAEHLIVFGKGNDKQRKVPFSPKLLERIHKFLWGKAKHIKSGTLICKLNGKPLGEEHGTEVFRAAKMQYLASTLIDKAELLAWEKRKYHTLRKCYATNAVTQLMLDGKSPWIWLPEWMGHNDVSTTRGYIFFEAVLNQRLDIIESLSLSEQSSRHYD